MKIHVATHKANNHHVEIEFDGQVAQEHQEILDGTRKRYSPEVRARIQQVCSAICSKDNHGTLDDRLVHHYFKHES